MGKREMGLSTAQKLQIEKLLNTLWRGQIYEQVLTQDQRENVTAINAVAFEMAKLLKCFAIRFTVAIRKAD